MTTAPQTRGRQVMSFGAGRSRYASPTRRTNKAYLFIAPFVLLYSVLSLYPIFRGAFISMHRWEIVGTLQEWVGFENYRLIMTDKLFWQAMKNTVYFVLMSGPVLIVVGLGFALVLNRAVRGMGALRTVYYLPNLLSVAVLGIIWGRIYAVDATGLINSFLGKIGVDPIPFLQDPRLALPAVAFATLWWTVGFNMIIFLAALQDIPRSLYDAVDIDGANWRQRFFAVTLPGLRRAMVFVLVLQVIASFQVFGQVDVMTSGGPAGATRTIVYYIFEQSFNFWRLGYGSALAMVLLVVLLGVSSFQLFLARRWEE